MRVYLNLLAFLIGLAFWARPIGDPDLGWHLLGGNWILANRALPDFDFINTFSPTWIDYHWLGQIILSSLFELGGFSLLQIFKGLLLGYTLKLCVDICYLSSGKRSIDSIPLVALVLLLACFYHMVSVRPQLLALTVIALALRSLLQGKHQLLFLFALSVFLVNVHVYWIVIPFLWFMYRCIPRLLKSSYISAGKAWGGLALLSAAGLCSPYLFLNYYLIWEYLNIDPILTSSISEFQPALNAKNWVTWVLLAIFALLTRVLNLRLLKGQLGVFAAAAIFIFLAIKKSKFLPLMAICMLPLLCRHLACYIRLKRHVFLKYDSKLAKPIVGICILAAGLTCVLNFPLNTQNQTSWLAELYPIKACQAISKQSVKIRSQLQHIRILTHFNDGGWCRWVLANEKPSSDYRVTSDGRTQLVPASHYQDQFNLFAFKQGWHSTLSKWSPDFAVVPRIAALANMLPYHPEWKTVYADRNFVVFRNRVFDNGDL